MRNGVRACVAAAVGVAALMCAVGAGAAPVVYVDDGGLNLSKPAVFGFSLGPGIGPLQLSGSPFATNQTSSIVNAPIGIGATPDDRYVYAIAPDPGESLSTLLVPMAVGAGGALSSAGLTPQVLDCVQVGELAITPDGHHLYAVSSDDDCAGVLGFTINSDGSLSAPTTTSLPILTGSSLAITPDGHHLYVAGGNGQIQPFAINADGSLTAGSALTVLGAASGASLAITPDGTKLYDQLTDSGLTEIFGATIGAGGALTLLGNPTAVTNESANSIAISADGTRLYSSADDVAGFTINSNGSLSALSGEPYAAPYAPGQIALTPDGTRLLALTLPGSGELAALTVGGSGVVGEPAGSPVDFGGGQDGEMAISPDPGPQAAFTPHANGLSPSFDASPSTGQYPVASYVWNFGDGTTASGVNVAHTYAQPGNYTVTLSEVDQAGCGQAEVYTGRIAYCGANPAAVTSQTISVASPSGAPPAPVPPVISNLQEQQRCVHSVILETPSGRVPGTGSLSFSYTLSENASVSYMLMYRTHSIRHRACPQPAPGSRSSDTYTGTGSVTVTGPGLQGYNSVVLGTVAKAGKPLLLKRGRHRVSLRLSEFTAGHQLPAGAYLLTIRATNAYGQRSNDAWVKFWVLVS